MQPDPARSNPIVLKALCRGTATVCAEATRSCDEPVVAIPVHAWTTIEQARVALLDAVVHRLTTPLEREADPTHWQRWRAALDPALCLALPGSDADLLELHAPASPVAAEPWQLADDEQTYGGHAGHWIVVDGSWTHDLSDAVPTEEEAQRLADAINAADPVAEAHRHWFAIHLPEALRQEAP